MKWPPNLYALELSKRFLKKRKQKQKTKEKVIKKDEVKV
jgi:hypothetical protein